MPFRDHFTVSNMMPLDDSNSRSETSGRRVWLNFLPNIDLGHLLTMIGFAAALTVQWNAMDKRITIIEQQQQQINAQYSESKADQKQTLQEVRSDIRTVKDTLQTISQTMAVAQYQLSQQKGGK
jgi:hypothetical protein